jgi:hypothetical protein
MVKNQKGRGDQTNGRVICAEHVGSWTNIDWNEGMPAEKLKENTVLKLRGGTGKLMKTISVNHFHLLLKVGGFAALSGARNIVLWVRGSV